MSRGHPVPRPTARLVFRHMTTDDLDSMATLLGDPVVMRHYPRPRDRAGALAWIHWNQRLHRQEGFGLWLISRHPGDEFVGDCGLTPQDIEGTVEIEVGYHVRADLQGRGYATEAATACRDYASEVLGVKRLVAIIHPDNVPSRRVAEKIGLTHERDATSRTGQPVRIHSIAL